ncbi:tRNA pseudouridine32 synthase / 23S rRNA pseudouridine746 synthase [Colwellia chukchiensis]|uniref:tRNA pseudouridine32 synthase / 23S rRNA pseudouridine746 synthase n=1 Tax=Colwellia chukchiensis TaxID=641665 RepID=A0A1H7S7V2_9GAMM|nr:RluA family pseudouridine synthase [Colwellia chukchiensis]SEL67814.1 tRNA pseudouridine32 synthase / 23S rRNA pseudouridine746 synthase [Colwellia chukchiensis]
MQKFQCQIHIEQTISITAAIQSHCQLSVSDIKKAIDKGALWLSRGKSTQRCRRLKKALKVGDVLHFYYDEAVLAQVPTPATLIADLVDYSVWYKPYGMLCQGSKWSDHCTITRWAQKHLTPERAVFPVHRLDRAATGLIIVAHSKSAARALSAMFAQHQLEKIYQIICHGDHRQRPQPETVTLAIDGKAACSHFSLLAYDAERHLSQLQVKIESGRKHQIRIHAASIGLPVVGDRLHGIALQATAQVNTEADLQLCAVTLRFTCPMSHVERVFTLPEPLRPQLANLR